MTPPLALYVHIPFCAVRCHYCDFNTYARLERLYEPFTTALVHEIRQAGAARGRPAVRTLFIGGGTPTVLPLPLLSQVIQACREAFDVSPDAEITSEANPGTADADTFERLRGLGINRLSMGVQSFNDAELQWLGRIHGADEAERAFEAARSVGFDNINLDFMFGLPGQTSTSWEMTLSRALRLAPEHLSLYSLTVETGTPLALQVDRGLAQAPDDDVAAELYALANGLLTGAGYMQYEISNYARPDHECRHNLVYWHHEPYIGFGPGAHSFDWLAPTGDAGRRWWNVRPVPEYVQRLESGRTPERAGEKIDRRAAMGELMMLGLRLVGEGVSDARFRTRFGIPLADVFEKEIERLVTRGLLEATSTGLCLTAQGRLLGNQVFAEFLSV
jgi:oxygen-independent coproporphyrinogen III oxidase